MGRSPAQGEDGGWRVTDNTLPHLSAETTDTPVRGYVPLRSGETAIVLDGGRVLVCKAPRLLNDHASERLLSEWEGAHRVEACGLAAIRNAHGPSREAVMARRREVTQKARDRVTMTFDDADAPGFCDGALGTGMTEIERRARTEAMARTVPDV